MNGYFDLIDNRFSELIERLESFANLNTHTYNLENLDLAIDRLEQMFAELNPDESEQLDPVEVELINSDGTIKKQQHGKILRLRKRTSAKLKILLCGHYDTVYPKDHPFQKVIVNGNIMKGPGVLDMKGGLMTMLYALLAYENSDLENKVGWEVLIVSDEEVGSTGSYPHLKHAAENNDIGLLYEPSYPDGRIVSDRKGGGNYTMIFTGKSAHAGRDFHAGINAFDGVADVMSWAKSYMRWNKGVTINIAKIEGGGPYNVVPDLAICRFNCRVETEKQQKKLCENIQKLCDKLKTKFPNVELHGKFTSPPKPFTQQSKAIADGILECASELGITNIGLVSSGGASDGNKLNAYGLPNIDSLGPVGNHMHSDKEMLEIDSLKQRTKLSALYLYKITKE